jgi:hypothetical protein
MSDHRVLPPLHVAPRTSWRLLLLVLMTHGGALAVLGPLAETSPWLRAMLGLMILMSLAYVVWAQVLRRAPWSVVAVDWKGGGWEATFADGRVRKVGLSASTYVGVGLVILHLNAGGLHRPCLLLTDDSLDPEPLRRLRMLLRLGVGRGQG